MTTKPQFLSLLQIPSIALMVAVRGSASILMLFFPLEGALLDVFLDAIDGIFVAYANLPKSTYHYLDKIIDYSHYVFIMVIAIQLPIAPLLTFLFLYRSIGHILYHFFHAKTWAFVVFTNLFELIFILHLIFERFQLPYSVMSWQVMSGCFIFKIFNELYVHFFPLDIPFKLHAWAKNKGLLRL